DGVDNRAVRILERNALAETVGAAVVHVLIDRSCDERGSPVGRSVKAIKDRVRQTRAGKEVLRQSPAAERAVHELVAELERSVPDVAGAEVVANIVIR